MPIVPLLVGGQAMIWLAWPWGVAGTLGAYGGTVVVAMVWRLVGQGLREQPVNYLRDIAATVLLATWVPLFASFTALLIFPDNGGARVLHRDATVVFADIGGYTAGVLFGKHLMVPAISPKKSWEGLGGSLLFGITAAVLSVAFLLHKPAWVGLPLGLDAGDHRRPRRPGRVPGQARPRASRTWERCCRAMAGSWTASMRCCRRRSPAG